MKAHTRPMAVVLLVILILFFVQSLATAQVASGSLNGTVYDSSGAVVPNAKVELKNEASGVTRTTVSNSVGYFNFVAVQPASYTVTISAQGFANWQMTKIVFNQAENRTMANIALKPGAATENITVEATLDAVPLDTAESRMTLNTNMVTQMAIQGRDAAELLKIMPGMGMNGGLSQEQYTSLTTDTNSGPIGRYTASGNQPYGPIAMISDGANIVDTGNQGTQIQNLNQDQIAEVTILNSSYGAEFAKGPVTFQAISKRGGNQFHGSGYLYTRNSVLNANDSYFKARKIDKPEDSQYYPGFTFGGPVLLPGTNFNRNRDKLFFFTGFEYMKQNPFPTLHEVLVPTTEMLQGNFSPAYLSSIGMGNFWSMAVPCANTGVWNYGNFCGTAAGQAIQGGMIPTSMFDPNSLALAKLFPAPNQDPATHQGYNYRYLDNSPLNRWEFKATADYVLSEKTKLSGSFTKQNQKQINNFGVWWWPGDTLPYPSPLNAQVISHVWSANLTHTFSPTLTNEFTFGYAYFTFPPKLANPSAVDPAKIGFNAKGPFSPDITPQIPNTVSWACFDGSTNHGCFPGFYAPGFPKGFQGGAFGNQKYAPNFADNIAKVFRTHTLKFGFYWDLNRQYYTTGYNDWGQGMYSFDPWGWNSTNNPLADFLLGHPSQYDQTSRLSIIDLRYKQIAFYAQDAWKAHRRLTITYGVRFDHEGQWYPAGHPGLAVWDGSKYSNAANAPQFSGMTWHTLDNSVPISGFKSKAFYPSPRVGVAYDIFGTGKTVLRGGFGFYRWQLSDNDTGIAFNVPLGIQTVSFNGELKSLADAANTFTPGVVTGFNGNAMALAKGDDRTPYTQNWNFIVSQEMWGKSTLELQYAGNRTRDALFAGNGANMNFFANINKIPMGALFGPDPVTGVNHWADSCAAGDCQMPNNTNEQHYRPYLNYGDALDVVTHGAYSNYHAFMVNWQKTRGPITFQANYTFSKVLGIRDGQTNNGGGTGATLDPFNVRANYGPLAYDHSHIFNVAYVINLPSPVHNNALLGGVANGWQLAGIIQAQSGAPIQPNTSGNLNAQFSGVGNTQILGTDAVPLVPLLTCNPKSGLKSGQYFNPDCFTGPQQGSNGTVMWPYIKGPGYSNADLSIYKNFKIKESKNVQFRWNMFNFLNHPLPVFGYGNDVNLNFTATRTMNPSDPTHPTYTYVMGNTCDPNQPRAGQACTDGRPSFTLGRRIMEFAVKFEF